MAHDGMHLVLLLIALLAFSSSAKVFLSIDCGASDTYTDENMIKWTTDDGYIKTGKSQMVPSYNSISQVMDTLRVFTTGKKNCYSIKVDKGEKVLVRASFYYSNYDNKLDPPTFDVQLNGKYWVTVENDIGDAYEGIYVVEEGDISVCLVQTFDGQFPYISALEVRSLDANMYSHVDANRALYLIERSFASNDQIVRYPDDTYDRVWNPTNIMTTITNAGLTIGVSNATDNPPQAALQEALTSSWTSFPVEFSFDQLPANKVPVYVNMYFAELDDTFDTTDERSFDVYIDDERLTSTPITPSYGSAMEFTFANITASSTTVFSLKATFGSTMPPIINAFELFVFGGDSSSSSNNNNNNNNGNDDSKTGTENSNDSNNNNDGKAKKKKKNNNNGSDDSSNKLPAIVGSTFSIFLVIWAIAGFILIYHYKRKSAIARGKTDGGVMPNETPDNSTRHILANGQY